MRPHLRKSAAIFLLVGALALTGCSSKAHWVDAGGKPATTSPATESAGPTSTDAPAPEPTISAPVDGAADVPAGTQIAYSAPDGTTTAVTLTAADGSVVAGGAGYDPSTWVPTKQLAYGEQYTAKVTSTGTDGKSASKSISFTTMARPATLIRVQSWLGDNMVYGSAVPIVLTFDHVVGDNERAGVQKRLSITTTPAQVGSWSWISATEIHWRPQVAWKAGSKFFVNVQTGGVFMGNGYYGADDLTVTASISAHPMTILDDDTTHLLSVYIDGKAVKRFPASMGKKSTPSSSGNLVIMSRRPSEEFDSSLGTGGTPVSAPGGYKELVQFTMRLTWSGQYIHAAPWSVKDQGKRDVSHGCTNISLPNAQWLYNNSVVGVPVLVKGTPAHVAPGNGWTDWDVSWATYIKGSALPPSTTPAPAPSPSAS